MKKILIAITILAFVMITGTAVILKQKISPKELKKIALDYSAKNFPNAVVEIGDINMSLGLKVSFTVDKLSVSEKLNEKILPALKLNGLEIVVPLWSIIVGEGNIEINLTKPDIHLVKNGEALNFVRLFKNPNQENVPAQNNNAANLKDSKTQDSVELELPAFLLNSTINLRVADANLNYSVEQQKGNIIIEKIILKNIGLKSQPAFEINSNFKLGAMNDVLTLNATLIGQIEMSKLLTEKVIGVESVLKVDNLRLENANRSLPDVKIESSLKYFLIGDIALNYNALIGSNNKLSGEILVGSNGLEIKNINCQLFLDELLEIAGVKKDIPLQPNGAFLKLIGNIDINNQGRISNSLEWSTDKNIAVEVQGINITSLLKGSFKEKKIVFGATGNFLDGSYNLNAIGEFDLNQKQIEFEKMGPFEITVDVDRIKLTEEVIQPFLISSPARSDQAIVTVANPEVVKEGQSEAGSQKTQGYNFPLLPETTFVLNLKDSTFDKSNLALNMKLKIKKQSINSEKFNIFLNNGSISNKMEIKLFKKQINGNVYTDVKSVELNSFHLFMPKIFNQISGDFTGNFKADFELPSNTPIKYYFSTTANIKNGELKGLNLKEFLSGQIDKIPNAIKADNIPITQNFKLLTVNATGDANAIEIKKSHFIGLDEKVEIKSTGKLFMPGSSGQSELLLDLTDHSGALAKSLEKYAATNTIPLKLKGKEFALALDYGFTTQKLLKLTLKNKGNELLKEKAPELIKQHLPEKLKENENVKKLLKKFF
jgi:hypothetical protein